MEASAFDYALAYTSAFAIPLVINALRLGTSDRRRTSRLCARNRAVQKYNRTHVCHRRGAMTNDLDDRLSRGLIVSTVLHVIEMYVIVVIMFTLNSALLVSFVTFSMSF